MRNSVAQSGKRTFRLVIIGFFLLNLFGYIGYRYFISQNLYGGDAINVSVFFLDSLRLKKEHFADRLNTFIQKIDKGASRNPETDPDAFVYHALSQEGKDALERLSEDIENPRDEMILILDLNRSLIDGETDWPTSFLPD